MKTISDILHNVDILEIKGNTNNPVFGISFDSRKVSNNFVFVAVRGVNSDGHDFIETAILNGATSVVCEEMPVNILTNICYMQVENTSRALGIISSNFFDNPSSKLKIIGVTGTNGKTTIVTLLHSLFMSLGYPSGMLSTIVNKIENTKVAATHTTPDPVSINRLLNDMVIAGCEFAFMEVSSHAIVQNRIAGLNFSGGIFTNITHDHLDYHKIFKEYIKAKKKFFDELTDHAFALVNSDDRNAQVMVQNTKAAIYTYGLKNMADFKGVILENELEGVKIKINNHELFSLLIGEFNAYNLLAVYGTSVLLELDEDEVLIALSTLKGADGRFEILRAKNGITGIIDYAHTPDALKNVLQTIQKLRKGNEQVITVVGAGGDRDKKKRPLMASVAAKYSDRLILTSDNPRSENPENILKDMMDGLDVIEKKNALIISNRKEAIKAAWQFASTNDIILIAGKGHEKYQEIKGVRYPFDDKEILIKLFE